MKCRGRRKRKEIYKQYPFWIDMLHFATNEEIKSDAGGILTKEYFVLYLEKEKNSQNFEIIVCGRPTAIDFCKLYNKKLPKIFNPFKEECSDKNPVKSDHENNDYWNPSCKQLQDALMIFLNKYGKKKYHEKAIEIKANIQNKHGDNFDEYCIKSVNTLYKEYKQTARGLILELEETKKCKSYKFDLLIQYLSNINVKQNFEITDNKNN